jgi:hypothetical protein
MVEDNTLLPLSLETGGWEGFSIPAFRKEAHYRVGIVDADL